ncbi:MAG: hypothetical protein ACFFDP_11515, partial [Promethearchaeota archaeon]
MDRKFLMRRTKGIIRLPISRAKLFREGEFVIATKASIGKGKGLAILYGAVMEDGKPTLMDWTCLGAGNEDTVKMVDVCGEVSYEGQYQGIVTATKDRKDGLYLVYWCSGLDFRLDENLRQNPWDNQH